MSSSLRPSKYSGDGTIFLSGQDVVHELPCLRSVWSMQTALLCRTKSLAAYWLGSVDAWTITKTDFSCEYCGGTDWFRWNIKINLLNGINDCRRFYCQQSKPCYYLHSQSLPNYSPIQLYCKLPQRPWWCISWLDEEVPSRWADDACKPHTWWRPKRHFLCRSSSSVHGS